MHTFRILFMLATLMYFDGGMYSDAKALYQLSNILHTVKVALKWMKLESLHVKKVTFV